jgi:hypothetical protein
MTRDDIHILYCYYLKIWEWTTLPQMPFEIFEQGIEITRVDLEV